MGIDITSFLEDCRSRGLTKQTIATYRSNVSTYLDFVGYPLKADTSQLQKFLDYLRGEMVYTVGKTRKKGVSPAPSAPTSQSSVPITTTSSMRKP
ncbi:MAG: hypothetical protein GQ533_09805 [Methanosarcinaceae archaeon]|nr:hypothetical protein [Methanosarcinaceae archaeon]